MDIDSHEHVYLYVHLSFGKDCKLMRLKMLHFHLELEYNMCSFIAVFYDLPVVKIFTPDVLGVDICTLH